MIEVITSTARTFYPGANTVIGTTLNQRFTLEKELGRGGMGAVYRATDQVLQRTIAIKVLKEQTGDDFDKRIRLEAQILARLLHDHIVRIYDFGYSEGIYYLVMEEVDGTSFVRRWRRLALPERLRILAQVAGALDYAHHQGVIHRDVKPGNVLLTATDQPKLSDFGLSVLAEQSDETGTIRGTPQYMSPEQAKGRRVDHRSDLYSLGVMLYECATGGLLFQGASLTILAQHINDPPPPPSTRNPEVSPALEALILKLLAKDPADRPPSGDVVAEALREEIEQDQALRSAPTTRLPGAGAIAGADGAGTSPGGTAAPPRPEAPAPEPEPERAATGAPAVAQAGAAAKSAMPLARSLLEAVVADPIQLTPEERYLAGHYLAYLLGGSRRRGFLLRRPLDPLNADRARLLLAMTAVMLAGATDEAIGRAAEVLDRRPDVRPALSPVVVAKYLASRDTPGKRKRFRQARQRVQAASAYAQRAMTDVKGVLNPGLMPQKLDDLRKLAPERDEVDDQLVSRWNRVAEVWRLNPEFRAAVLRYATRSAARDPASAALWPEVVYPLIERARWQRRLRSGAEALLDHVCGHVLHVPDAGLRMDRAIRLAVPEQVVEKLDLSLGAFEDDPHLEAEAADPQDRAADRLAATAGVDSVSLHELAADVAPAVKGTVRLTSPDPIRFTLGDLRPLWNEAVAALRHPGSSAGHRHVAIGPYHLAVIPSIRGRSAGQVAIQGMSNKQIEMLTPSIRMGGSGSKPIVAAWVYQDNSLAIAYVDSLNTVRYICWHAPTSQQSNFGNPADLNHALFQLGMEAPDQLDRALTRSFRPRNPV
jgi:serine/threonine-protein kinase